MVLRDDGQVQGSVSGGCIEDDLIRRAAAGEFTDESGNSAPRILRYGVTADEAHRFGLPCGGTLELVLEAAPDAALLEQLAQRISTGQLVERRVALASGIVSLAGGRAGDSQRWDGQTLVTLHGPAWRLLIIGAGQISRYLATMAQALGYRVYICDPRSEYADGWDVAGTERIAAMPDDAVSELGLDPRSAVVALTHDPKLDDMALLEALKSPAFYVGALGSRANNRPAPRTPAAVFRPLAGRGQPLAWPGRPAHRQPHTAGNRRLHPGRNDRSKKWATFAVDRKQLPIPTPAGLNEANRRPSACRWPGSPLRQRQAAASTG